MRYYLDTNMLIFVLTQDNREIGRDVEAILNDSSNLFYVSMEVVRELIHLIKIKKLEDFRNKKASDVFRFVEEANVEVKPVTRYHLETYATLETAKGHRDPTDHLIISQAISDRIPLISTDREFKHYTSQGLQLISNKR